MSRARKAALPWGEIGAATFGAAVGGVLGMLFSPNTGKRNRQLVAKEARKVTSTATRAVKQVRKEAAKIAPKAAVTHTVRRTSSARRKVTKK